MHTSRVSLVLLLASLGLGCATTRRPTQQIEFEGLTIRGDLELEKLNDEELFTAGSSFFAANDYKQAARYFSRLADFHPHSPHRRAALYNAGLSYEKLKQWEDAYPRFIELADPHKGTGDSLDAAFRLAETLYHSERFDDAAAILNVIERRTDLGLDKRVEAQTQKGICELEAGKTEQAESTLRKVVATYQDLSDKEQIDDYFPAQAQFFLGEIYRIHYESVSLDPARGTDQLAKDLEYKSELLLSAQGHYLRSIRIGNGYWATASGAQIGGLYENLYEHMVNSPAPSELSAEEADVYRQEIRRKIRVLLSKAITIYERTLETAERIGSQSPFVERTRASLRKMKDQLLVDAQADEESTASPAEPQPVPHT